MASAAISGDRPASDADLVSTIVVRGDAAGGVWAGGFGGVLRWRDAQPPPDRRTDGDVRLDNHVFDVAVAPDGTVWPGTASGRARHTPDCPSADAPPVPPNPDDAYQRRVKELERTPA